MKYPVRLALAAIAIAALLDVALVSQPPTASSMGIVGNPFEHPVPMSGECNARVLASGVVDAAEHEAADGFFAVGGVSLSVHRGGIPALQLRALRGQRVDLMVRIVEPRTLRKGTR